MEGLSGRQKVAVVLAQLATEQCAAILAQLPEDEALALTNEIAELPFLDGDVVRAVVGEFVARLQAVRSIGQGGVVRARAILTAAVGPARAEELVRELARHQTMRELSFLSEADPRYVVPLLLDEHPQLIALVVAHLSPSAAAGFVSAFPPSFRTEVVERIATMGRVEPDTVGMIVPLLAAKLGGLEVEEWRGQRGISALVAILNQTKLSTERQVLAALEESAPELAEQAKTLLFTFEDLVGLEDREIQVLLRAVNPTDLALAIKGCGEDSAVAEVLMRNLSERALLEVEEELKAAGPIRRSMVEGAQMNILRRLRKLEEQGAVVIFRPNEGRVV